jgi:O-antigen ligase
LFFGEGLWSGYTPLSTGGVRKLAFTHGLYLTLAFFPSILYLIFINVHKKYTRAMGWHVMLSFWMLGIVGTLMRHLWIALLGVLMSLWIFLPNEKRKLFIKTITKLAVPFMIGGVCIFYVIVMNPQSIFSRQLEKTLGFVSTRAISVVSSGEDESFSWRSLVWKSAYERFQSNPLLGIGTGEKIYVEKEGYREFIEGRNIHNSYLAILIQLGIVGIGLFLSGVYMNIKNLFFSQGDDEYMFYKFSILSVMAIYILAMPFQPYLEANLLAIFFWMSLGLARILPEIKK